VAVERAGPAEADRVADLWVALAAGQRDHGSHLLADPNRDRIRETLAHQAADGRLLVAREDGGMVGFATVEPDVGRYEGDTDRGVVTNLYVAPDHRREGVGSALLAAAEDRLRELGARRVGLEVLAANEGARRFYRRAGYEPHRVELERPLGGENDTHSKGDD